MSLKNVIKTIKEKNGGDAIVAFSNIKDFEKTEGKYKPVTEDNITPMYPRRVMVGRKDLKVKEVKRGSVLEGRIHNMIGSDTATSPEYVIHNGVCFVLSGKAYIIIDEITQHDEKETNKLDNIPLVIVHESAIIINGNLKAVEYGSSFSNCHIRANEVYLVSSKIEYSNVNSGSLLLKDTNLTCCAIAGIRVIINNSSMMRSHIMLDENSTIDINEVTGSKGPLKIGDLGLYNIGSLTVSMKGWDKCEDELVIRDIDSKTTKPDVNITSRYDYGLFDTKRKKTKIVFCRCNDHDMIVNGYFFDSDLFILAALRYFEEINQNPHKFNGMEILSEDKITDPNVVLTDKKYNSILSRISKLSNSKKGKPEFTGLVFSIRSRMNTYKAG